MKLVQAWIEIHKEDLLTNWKLAVGRVFKGLKNKSYFSLVRPAHHGIMWPNEQDFSSDTIIWDIKNDQPTGEPDNKGLLLIKY